MFRTNAAGHKRFCHNSLALALALLVATPFIVDAQDTPPVGSQVPGDMNQDTFADMTDALILLEHVILDMWSPPCVGSISSPANTAVLDLDGSRSVGMNDAVYLLLHIYLSGPPPVQGTSCMPVLDCPVNCP